MATTDVKQISSLDFNTLVSVNNLRYQNIGSPTLVEKRTQRKFYAKKTEYTGGENVEVSLSVGSDLVYGPNSFLVLCVKTDHGVSKFFQGATKNDDSTRGSALNLIQSVLIKTRGKEIDRCDHKNLLMKYLLHYENDTEYLHAGVGSAMGTNVADFATKTCVAIPLMYISDIFGNKDQLIPHQIINNMDITLKLEDGVTAFTWNTPPAATTYKVSDAYILLDQYSLKDSASLHLQKEASTKSGLVFSYKSWYHQTTNANAVTSISSNVGAPHSQTLRALSVVRNSTDIANDSVDSFRAITETDASFPKWRYLFGSMSFPEQKVDSPVESYMLVQQVFQKMRDNQSPNSIDIDEYKGQIGVIAQSFERHGWLLEQSGLSLNIGGRNLILEWNKPSNGNNLVIDTFMEFTRVISAYSDGKLVISD